jgi:DNA-binding beta-propeller fold protein YncE
MTYTRTLSLLALAASLAACQTAQPVAPAASAAPLPAATKTIPVGKSPHGIGAANGFVYNTNVADKTVSVIDAASDTVVSNLTMAAGVTPGYQHEFREKYMLTTDTAGGALMVYDTSQQHKLLQTIPLGKGPDKIRHTPDEKSVVVSLTGETKLVMLTFGDDMAKAPERKDFTIGAHTGEHRSVELGGGYAVIPNVGDNNTSLVNLSTGEVKAFTDGNTPAPVGIGESNETAVAAIVGNTASNTLSIFAIPTGEKTTLTGVGLAPTDMVVDDELHRAYVTMSGSNEVAVVDFLEKKLVTKLPTGNRPVHIYRAPKLEEHVHTFTVLDHEDPLSHEIWVGNDSGESVTIIDGEKLTVRTTIRTGVGHHKMAFWGSKGYVSNITDGTVAMIDRATLK